MVSHDKQMPDEISISELHEIARNGNGHGNGHGQEVGPRQGVGPRHGVGPRPFVLDVRTHFEWVTARLPFTSERVSYDAVADALDRLPEDRSHPIYVYCRVGHRSRFVTDYLKAIGYRRVFNVTGGIVAWTLAGLPVERGE